MYGCIWFVFDLYLVCVWFWGCLPRTGNAERKQEVQNGPFLRGVIALLEVELEFLLNFPRVALPPPRATEMNFLAQLPRPKTPCCFPNRLIGHFWGSCLSQPAPSLFHHLRSSVSALVFAPRNPSAQNTIQVASFDMLLERRV